MKVTSSLFVAIVVFAVVLPSGTWALSKDLAKKCQSLTGIESDKVTSKLCTQSCKMDTHAALFHVHCKGGKASKAELGKTVSRTNLLMKYKDREFFKCTMLIVCNFLFNL